MLVKSKHFNEHNKTKINHQKTKLTKKIQLNKRRILKRLNYKTTTTRNKNPLRYNYKNMQMIAEFFNYKNKIIL